MLGVPKPNIIFSNCGGDCCDYSAYLDMNLTEFTGISYQWKINSTNIGANPPSFLTAAHNGKMITCVISTSCGSRTVSKRFYYTQNGNCMWKKSETSEDKTEDDFPFDASLENTITHNGLWNLSISKFDLQEISVQVYSIDGRLVWNQRYNNSESNQFIIGDQYLSPGIYIIRVICLKTNESKTLKAQCI